MFDNNKCFPLLCLDREPRPPAQQKAAQVFQQNIPADPEEDGRPACLIHSASVSQQHVVKVEFFCAGPQCCSLGAGQEGNQNYPGENTSAGFYPALHPLTPLRAVFLFMHLFKTISLIQSICLFIIFKIKLQ